VRLVVHRPLLRLSGDRRPRLRQHRPTTDKSEDLVEICVIVAELLHGALGLRMQGVEAALRQGDVQRPILAS